MDIGAQLRAAREAKGLSTGTLSRRTRIHPRFLAAIELNDLTLIPPRPFGRGFVRAYAEEVGLEPEHTANAYFAQFPSTRQADSVAPALRPEIPDTSFELSSHWGGLATAITILVVLVATAVVLGRRGETTSEAAKTESAPPAAPRDTPAPAPATEQASQPAVGTTGATPTSASAPLTIALSFKGPCWVAASADGQQVIYRLLPPGERQTLTASKEVLIRFGDAGVVTWTINGRDPGPLGLAGAVRDFRITPQNAATVK